MKLLRSRTFLVALGVFVLSLVVRMIGIGWGLPNDLHNQSYHPDEPVVFAYSQQIEPMKGDFTPGFYNYGTFYLTLLRVSTDVVNAYGGGPTSNSESAQWQTVGRYHLAGRVLSAIAGAATVLFVFLILRTRVGEFGSLMGAAAMCFAPGHVVHSRFQTVDVLATFLLTVSLYFALRVTERGSSEKMFVKWAVWSGVFAGLSAGTKYTGLLALVALAVVCALSKERFRWRAMGFGVLASLLTLAIVTPGAVLDSTKFFQDFSYEMTHTQTGHGLVFAGTPSGFLYHWGNLFVAMGPVLVVFGVLGLVRAAIKKHAWAIALLAFAVVYFVLIGRSEVKFMRYVFPLVPAFAVGFGWMVSRAHESPKAGLRFVVMFFAIMGVGGVFGGGAIRTAHFTSWMTGEDPRDTIARELKEASDQNTTVGLVSDPWFYTPPLFPDTALPRAVPFDERNMRRLAASSPRVVQYIPMDPSTRFDFDVRLLTELNPDYVVTSSFEIGDLARIIEKLPSPPAEYKTQIGRAEEFMDILLTRYDKWKVHGSEAFGLPHDVRYIRPEIEVWKKKTDLNLTSLGSSTTSPSSGAPVGTR